MRHIAGVAATVTATRDTLLLRSASLTPPKTRDFIGICSRNLSSV